jgi:hypothetical protein
VGAFLSLSPLLINPDKWERISPLPAMGLLRQGELNLDKLQAIKKSEQIPVHIVFPAGSAREAQNLAHLLPILEPLYPSLIDRCWIAFGGRRPGNLDRLAQSYPWVELFQARLALPPDQQDAPDGKGATMRAFLYQLVLTGKVSHPRAIIEFIDADIRPSYFNPRWVIDPVGALIWFQALEAAKVVYHRPHGGRLNAILRSFLALCPDPAIQSLQKLVYLLSGEMAGTLKFWTALPFKTGYGVEILLLLSLALNQLRLSPEKSDLEKLIQVYVGQMDHRHAPLLSSDKRRGLDQMAGNVFHTCMEYLEQVGMLQWKSPSLPNPRLSIPLPPQGPNDSIVWLDAALEDETLPPLRTLPEIKAIWEEIGK